MKHDIFYNIFVAAKFDHHRLQSKWPPKNVFFLFTYYYYIFFLARMNRLPHYVPNLFKFKMDIIFITEYHDSRRLPYVPQSRIPQRNRIDVAEIWFVRVFFLYILNFFFLLLLFKLYNISWFYFTLFFLLLYVYISYMQLNYVYFIKLDST